MKTCSKCREPKTIDQFGPSKQTPDGLFRYCRSCKQAADRASHQRHKARRSVQKQGYYRSNAEVFKARATAQYERDRVAGKARALAWAAANAERRLEIRRQSATRCYALNPEPKRETWRRRHAAIKRGCAVYPFTTEQLAAKVAYWNGRCWICSGLYGAIDHVKPLAKQGPHMIANLRPICTPCNTRKRDRWPYPAA